METSPHKIFPLSVIRVEARNNRQLSPDQAQPTSEPFHVPFRAILSKDRSAKSQPRQEKEDASTSHTAPKQNAHKYRESEPSHSATKVSQLTFNFVEPKQQLQAAESKLGHPYAQRRYRRRPILPQLVSSSQNEPVQPATNKCNGVDPANPTKMLDLMIDILKQESRPAHMAATPKNQYRPSRFRTEPSMDRDEILFYEMSCGKSRQKMRGPKVLENEIIKQSINMNVVRKKMLSEHRNRIEEKCRSDIKSSENHNRVLSSKDQGGTKMSVDEMQMTFYPKSKEQHKPSEDLYDNEFISIGDINWIRK